MAAGMCWEQSSFKREAGWNHLHSSLQPTCFFFCQIFYIWKPLFIFQARTFDCNVLVSKLSVKSRLNIHNLLLRIINVKATFTPVAHQPLWAGFLHTHRLNTAENLVWELLTDIGKRPSLLSHSMAGMLTGWDYIEEERGRRKKMDWPAPKLGHLLQYRISHKHVFKGICSWCLTVQLLSHTEVANFNWFWQQIY